MLFSRSTEYAIRALTFLATQPAGKLAGAREISEAEQIPMPFLWKILQNLARRRLIRSFKGLRGGYELAQPADKLTLRMIVSACDGAGRTDRCVLGLTCCSEEHACPLHDSWKDLRANLDMLIETSTLADLAGGSRKRTRPKAS